MTSTPDPVTVHPIDTEALRRLADQATPGPWRIDEHGPSPLASIVSTADDRPWGWVEVGRSIGDDASFIAAAREAVPELLDQLDKAEARIKAVRKLHTPFEWSFGYGPVRSCRECARRSPQEDAAYPCPTIRALDGDG